MDQLGQSTALRVTIGNSPRASWKITSPVWLFGEEVPTTGHRLNSGIPERIQAIHTTTKASDLALLVPSLCWAAGWWSLLRLPHLPMNSGPASPGKAPGCFGSCHQALSALNISPSGSQPYQFAFSLLGPKIPSGEPIYCFLGLYNHSRDIPSKSALVLSTYAPWMQSGPFNSTEQDFVCLVNCLRGSTVGLAWEEENWALPFTSTKTAVIR